MPDILSHGWWHRIYCSVRYFRAASTHLKPWQKNLGGTEATEAVPIVEIGNQLGAAFVLQEFCMACPQTDPEKLEFVWTAPDGHDGN